MLHAYFHLFNLLLVVELTIVKDPLLTAYGYQLMTQVTSQSVGNNKLFDVGDIF